MRANGLAFASDFDGTLCESDWEAGYEHVRDADIEAVSRFQEAGGLFGICTGRPRFSVERSLAGIIEPDFYIATTGAQVTDKHGTTLLEETLDRALAQELFERYGKGTGVFVVVTEDGFVSVGRTFSSQVRCVGRLSEIEGRILGVSLEYGGDVEAAARAATEVNERHAGVVEGFQNLGSVDIVRAGCSKGQGVRVAKAALGVHTIAGMGDSYNDLTLLQAADVAYTFPHAPAVVRKAADALVSSVAEALELLCS